MIFETVDFTEGKRVLNMYYSSVSSTNRPWSSFSECLDYYTIDKDLRAKYPNDESVWRYNDFIETLGRNSFILKNPAKLKSAIERVANVTTKTKLPTNWSFGQALVNEAQTFTFQEFKKATVEGLKDAGKAVATVAAIGIGTYLAWITGGLVLFWFIKKQVNK